MNTTSFVISQTDVFKALEAYSNHTPDPNIPSQLVSFGTSGHRGLSINRSFNELHIAAITQAIVDYRTAQGHLGPLFVGKDTHALSAPAELTVLRVLAANSVAVIGEGEKQFTPTPVISRAIIRWNTLHPTSLADGIIITPSHNPPLDGGLKYNPPNGGPADTSVTKWIELRANELIRSGYKIPAHSNAKASLVTYQDITAQYVEDLALALDIQKIAQSGIKVGVHPLGGSSLRAFELIQSIHGINLTIVDSTIDPTFSFMPPDHDGKIRMDCSSPFAMAPLISVRAHYDIAVGSDPDADRHGIVTPEDGLLNPNHFLAVAIKYLLDTRTEWSSQSAVGKTLVSSALIDRVVAKAQRKLFEVPVGFKWFVEGLSQGSLCFGGEESAGASFLCKSGKVWTTDKDGIVMGLLGAEILATTNKTPSAHLREIQTVHGIFHYRRADSPLKEGTKKVLSALSPSTISLTELGGNPVEKIETHASGNNQPVGGVKISTNKGWCAVRPSGTEPICKIYAESFVSESHRELIIEDAERFLDQLAS